MTPDLIGRALSRIKPRKAPGLDRVPSEVVACVVKADPEAVREMVTDTLTRGRVPASWKMARVILIPKPGKDPLCPRAYRPISVLPALSKVWEYAIKEILKVQLGRDPFHRNQFGFRRGVGTVQAATEVARFAEACRARNKVCLLLSFDVRNAFNTLQWDVILREMDRRGVDPFTRATLGDYFNNRGITVHSHEGTVVRDIYAGVPQGSVLGTFLWNAVYDGLLTELEVGESVRAIAYADDLALLFAAKDILQVRSMMDSVLPRVGEWFRRTGLTLAAEKTDAILLTGKRIQKTISLRILGANITTAAQVRYLGVVFDCPRKYRPHLEEVSARADRVSGALAALLPNTHGPSVHARRLYYSVWESVILHGAPVWAVSLRIEASRAILRRAQRTALIRCTAAYRTVSAASVRVLAGRLPLCIKAKMGRAIFCLKAKDREDSAVRGNPALLSEKDRLHKATALREAMEEWQGDWDQSPSTGWVRRLIPRVSTFVDASGPSLVADYWSMQLLSGHGAFQRFRHRIGKAPSEVCLDCGATRYDAEHVLTACAEFAPQREVLATDLGAPVEVNTIIDLATSSSARWGMFAAFAHDVMEDRARKEREADRLLREERARVAALATANRALARRRTARKRKR